MTTDFKTLWSNCLEIIRDVLPEAAYNTWFAPIVPSKYEDRKSTRLNSSHL